MWGKKDKSGSAPSPEEIIAMFPPIAQSLVDAANQADHSPTDMQSAFWNKALHSQ